MHDQATFIKKHPVLTNEDIKLKFLEADKAKKDYAIDMNEVEKNLLGLRDIIDPIVDPSTDKILAWMRRPTNEEIEIYYKWFEEGKKTSDKDKLEQTKRQYEIMASLITIPKHEWDWWKKNTDSYFVKLFSLRLTLFFEQVGVTTANF